MLEIGNGGLTNTEERTHFALWCFAKAPLILGNDLTQMTRDQLNIITNTNLIAINQDVFGQQAKCVAGCIGGDIRAYSSYNIGMGGYYGLLVVNWNGSTPKAIRVDFLAAGVTTKDNDSCKLTDLWTGNFLGTYVGGYYITGLLPHDNVALKVVCTTTVSNQ